MYFFFTTGSGLLTLGEEYCSILPKTKTGIYDQSSRSPAQLSTKTKIIYYFCIVAFPYIFNKWIIPIYRAKIQKAAQDSVAEDIKNAKTIESLKSQQPTFSKMIKSLLSKLFPESVTSIFDWIQHTHFAIFLIFGHYNELSRRFSRLFYFSNPRSKPRGARLRYTAIGRIIMFQVCFDILKFVYKIVSCSIQAYIQYKNETKEYTEKYKQLEFKQNQPEDKDAEEISQERINESEDLCSLCYGKCTNPSICLCGHLFCWDCIMRAIKIRPECPTCRKPCPPQKVLMLMNYC